MTRRLLPFVGGATLALAALLAGPTPGARAQYAVRGGPIIAGPVGGGPSGPSLFTGAYAPSFYVGPLPGAYGSMSGPGAGAGFVPNYTSSYPYFGGRNIVTVPTIVTYPQPVAYNVYAPPPPQRPYTPETQPNQAPGTPPSPGNRSAAEGPPPPAASPPVTPPVTGAAQFTVRVPADAKLWVENFQSKQTGPVRVYHTPANLQTGKAYEYTFRAQWQENGQTVTRDRTARFGVGSELTVDFTRETPR
jgi:uncharacterized protein (TIGR03000 family)